MIENYIIYFLTTKQKMVKNFLKKRIYLLKSQKKYYSNNLFRNKDWEKINNSDDFQKEKLNLNFFENEKYIFDNKSLNNYLKKEDFFRNYKLINYQ